MFSAVALVAFSFAGMANTIEEEKELMFTEEKVVLWNDCDEAADRVYNNRIKGGSSVDDASVASSAAYNDCLDFHNKHNISLIEVCKD